MADTEITIKLRPAGAAFSDHPREELAAILRKLADQLDSGWYATFKDLPTALLDSNGNTVGGIEVSIVEDSWADLLRQLPTIEEAQWTDLYVDQQGIRVWLSRASIEDGEPFATTVHVEEYDEDQDEWWEVGHFDGDVPGPKPAGVLGEAFQVTLDAVREAAE